MRKRFITVLAAVLLLAAVICSAGCITPAPDPILGTWYSEVDEDDENGATTVMIFEEGNTGTFVYLPGENEPADEQFAESFIWEAKGDYKYSLQFSESEETIPITMDMKSFTFKTKDKVVYTKMANISLILASLFG